MEGLFISRKSKQTVLVINHLPIQRTKSFYRNSIFLKADERIAENESLLNSKPFAKVEKILIDKNRFTISVEWRMRYFAKENML